MACVVAVACGGGGPSKPTLVPAATPTAARTTVALTGRFDGSVYFFNGTFTLDSPRAVDATAELSEASGSFQFVILKKIPDGHCSGVEADSAFLSAPHLVTRWARVEAGTYCMNVVRRVKTNVPYTWTDEVTY
jgi:hypothetical protein